jgi:hypothetical protein
MRRFLAALVFCACLLAQMKMTVAQLRAFIKSSIQLQHDDKQVADYLKKVHLTERLDDRTIEEMIGEGAGPRTINALRDLGEASAQLPKPAVEPAKPPAATLPPPSPEIQKKVIEEARLYSLNYTKNLPNFICLQVTRRYLDPAGLEFFSLQDTVATRLSYFEQKEDYKVVSINGQISTVSYERLDGATSSGEFGSMLREIFDPESRAQFSWERWGKLRGKVCHVYAYRVSKATSKWSISYQRQISVTPGYRGFIYVDRDVPIVMRVTLEAEDIPPTFPVQMASDMLDYDFVDIAGNEFLLPLRAEMRMRESRMIMKNVTEFRNYRKFGAEATITFETPSELSEDKVKEEKVIKPQ